MYSLTKTKQEGATLVVALLLLLVMMILALSISSNSSSHAMIANSTVLRAQASQAAESGADVILDLINEDDAALNEIQKKSCSKGYADQFHAYGGKSSSLGAGSDDRGVQLSWYACVPDGASINDVTNCSDAVDCFAIVITGVACPKGIDVGDPACVTTRYLQGYGKKPN